MTDAAVTELTFRRPDDWHVHLRDGAMLHAVVGATAAHFARAVVMPNLTPPVTSVDAAAAYRARILAAVPAGMDFQPLMTCYLTDGADPVEIRRGFEAGAWVAAKLYPAHATTNAQFGVTDLFALAPVFDVMAQIGMPLLCHGETVDADVDVFDREAVFIDRTMTQLAARWPELKIVFEHVTTREAVQFVQSRPRNMAATITAHHLAFNRNAMFQGGIRPHFYCLPVAKREEHRLALRSAATSGDGRFFLGTDSAPHLTRAKEAACGCAGLFTAPTALATYLDCFAAEGALDKFEAFASLNGPAFYGLPVNETRMRARRVTNGPTTPLLDAAGDTVTPHRVGEPVSWVIEGA